MISVRLPKTKKSYHSKVVPAAEAATTVRRLAPLTALRLTRGGVRQCRLPRIGGRSSITGSARGWKPQATAASAASGAGLLRRAISAEQQAGGDRLADHAVHAGVEVGLALVRQHIGGEGHDRRRGRRGRRARVSGVRPPARRCPASARPSGSGRSRRPPRPRPRRSRPRRSPPRRPGSPAAWWRSCGWSALSSTTSTRRPRRQAAANVRGAVVPGGRPTRPETSSQKVEPSPGARGESDGLADIISASRRVIARPRPEPPNLRVVEASPWSNRWKMPVAAVGRDADAGVGDLEAQRGRGPARVQRRVTDPAFGEFHRVADQVEQRLAQPHRVGAHPAEPRRRPRCSNLNPLLLGLRPQEARDALHQGPAARTAS